MDESSRISILIKEGPLFTPKAAHEDVNGLGSSVHNDRELLDKYILPCVFSIPSYASSTERAGQYIYMHTRGRECT